MIGFINDKGIAKPRFQTVSKVADSPVGLALTNSGMPAARLLVDAAGLTAFSEPACRVRSTARVNALRLDLVS
jgi:hypothetical protein